MTMKRIVFTYGSIAGVLLIVVFGGSFFAGAHHGEWGMAIGYLTMFIAMSMVFVGVKRYRDEELGGVIRFWTAFALGLGIALVASLFYVFGWEAYMFATDYSFATEYTAGQIEALRASGASTARIAAAQAEADAFIEMYSNPLYRMPMTFTEISPVVLIIPLVSALLLRNNRFLPAR